MPHFSAVEGIKVALFVLAILGAGRLLALSFPNSAASQGFLLLY